MSAVRVKPDFFIAGAAKCGTTALFEYLLQHPGVFMPRLKEPKYFSTDLKTSGGVYTEKGYQALFESAPQHCLTGEASAMYLYSSIAIERIMHRNPESKIIVMLRHPVDAAHSLHAARWASGHENIMNFEEAWHAQAARLCGERLPRRWPDAATLQYGPMYRYVPQVRRVLQHVPEGQRHFIVYEDFFRDPRAGFAQVLAFLGVAPICSAGFPVVNPAVGPRSQRLDEWLRHPPRWVRTLYAPFRPIFRIAGINPSGKVRALNAVARTKPGLAAGFRSELERYFAPDIVELEAMLGRRLWSERSSSSASGRTLET